MEERVIFAEVTRVPKWDATICSHATNGDRIQGRHFSHAIHTLHHFQRRRRGCGRFRQRRANSLLDVRPRAAASGTLRVFHKA